MVMRNKVVPTSYLGVSASSAIPKNDLSVIGATSFYYQPTGIFFLFFIKKCTFEQLLVFYTEGGNNFLKQLLQYILADLGILK